MKGFFNVQAAPDGNPRIYHRLGAYRWVLQLSIFLKSAFGAVISRLPSIMPKASLFASQGSRALHFMHGIDGLFVFVRKGRPDCHWWHWIVGDGICFSTHCEQHNNSWSFFHAIGLLKCFQFLSAYARSAGGWMKRIGLATDGRVGCGIHQ